MQPQAPARAVASRTSCSRRRPLTAEIVIWDNASTDGHDRLPRRAPRRPHPGRPHRPQHRPERVRSRLPLTSAPYIIEVDDDIIEAPAEWDATLLDAFRRLPTVGFLAANLVDNPHDTTSTIMYHRDAHLYSYEELDGVRLKRGPVGGGCSITSRELYDRVGGFREKQEQVFWLEDAAYIADIEKLGFHAAYLDELRVLHAGGSYYATTLPEKQKFWNHYWRRVARRQALKRVLIRLPFVRRFNARFGWFTPPQS